MTRNTFIKSLIGLPFIGGIMAKAVKTDEAIEGSSILSDANKMFLELVRKKAEQDITIYLNGHPQLYSTDGGETFQTLNRLERQRQIVESHKWYMDNGFLNNYSAELERLNWMLNNN